MRVRLNLLGAILTCLCLSGLPQGCSFLQTRGTSDGLLPGLNYMQPQKWRMTYDYRVQQVTPAHKSRSSKPAAYDSSIPTVGNGTYEVWMIGPREGDELRDLKLVSATYEPVVKTDPKSGTVFYYLNFAPDGRLPQEIHATLVWEFTTFERYTYWDGIEKQPYDKSSDLYKQYTREEYPFVFHPQMLKVVKDAVKNLDPLDYQAQAAACYNELISNMSYDFQQSEKVAFSGEEGMTDSWRAWENKSGQCDEFTNVYVTMLREIGIPARPVAGFVHLLEGSKLSAGGHAWTEYYMPGVGWIPVDPTWGGQTQIIDPFYSPMGLHRKIPVVDYYYGKCDPYRLTMYKNWNYTLTPAPKTPKARKNETWSVGVTHRFSGVRDIIPGWNVMGAGAGETDGLGELPAFRSAGPCCDIRIELLGPADDKDEKEAIAAIKAEGAHYIHVPAMPWGHYPIQTYGNDMAD